MAPHCAGGTFIPRYGANQFLILLIGLHLEDSSVIQNRIDSRFLSFGLKARAAIEYKVQPAVEEDGREKNCRSDRPVSIWN